MQNKLLGYDEALALILDRVPILPAETVALDDALCRVLRAEVSADRDQPPFDRSAMDGYAVQCAQVATGRTFHITGSIAAGAPKQAFPTEMSQVMRIATGAPVPDGADSVIPLEQSQEDRSANPPSVQFDVCSQPEWKNIHRRGSDATAGQVLIEPGTSMSPHHLGVAATVGAVQLEVSQLPRITLLTSGDEVRTPDTPTGNLQLQQIRNSNGPMLKAICQSLGAPLLTHEHVADDREQTLAAARRAIAQSHLVLTAGGVSVGNRDLLPWAWEKLGFKTVLHGVAIQPGRPLFVAEGESKLIVGLPGNPVSVLATAHLFVWPIISKLLGLRPTLPWQQVELASAVRAKRARRMFRTVRHVGGGVVEAVQWQGSGDLMHTAAADGIVQLPLVDGQIEAGTGVPFLSLLR